MFQQFLETKTYIFFIIKSFIFFKTL